MITEFYTVRHAESDHNPGIFDVGDPEITHKGLRQARYAGRCATTLDLGLIISSPKLRAKQTTAAILHQLDYSIPVIYDARAVEQQYGPLAGMEKAAVYDTPDMIALGDQIGLHLRLHPDAETEADVADRVMEMAADYEGFNEGGVMIVMHGQSSKAPTAVAQGIDRKTFRKVKVPHASIALLDLNDPLIRTPLRFPAIV